MPFTPLPLPCTSPSAPHLGERAAVELLGQSNVEAGDARQGSRDSAHNLRAHVGGRVDAVRVAGRQRVALVGQQQRRLVVEADVAGADLEGDDETVSGVTWSMCP